MPPKKTPHSKLPENFKLAGATFLLIILAIVGLGVVPSVASECDTCIPCHGNLEDIHGDFNHSAAPGSGPVLIFADTDHDDAGWTGPKPYFDVTVACNLCHSTDLPAVHGNDCGTCHPTPYDTLGIWGTMYRYFSEHKEDFLEHYHKRSNVESVFSMIKARFGNNVRCKKETSQDNEILLKCLCHNLCCLVQEIFLNKIDINFKKCADVYVAHKR